MFQEIIIKEDIDKNEYKQYRLCLFESNLVLVAFVHFHKPKGKRKMRIKGFWDSINKTTCTCPEPELTDDIKLMAKEKFINTIVVKTFSEYKRVK